MYFFHKKCQWLHDQYNTLIIFKIAFSKLHTGILLRIHNSQRRVTFKVTFLEWKVNKNSPLFKMISFQQILIQVTILHLKTLTRFLYHFHYCMEGSVWSFKIARLSPIVSNCLYPQEIHYGNIFMRNTS